MEQCHKFKYGCADISKGKTTHQFSPNEINIASKKMETMVK